MDLTLGQMFLEEQSNRFDYSVQEADKCEWEVLEDNTIDQYPIRVQVGVELQKDGEIRGRRWILEKADWEK